MKSSMNAQGVCGQKCNAVFASYSVYHSMQLIVTGRGDIAVIQVTAIQRYDNTVVLCNIIRDLPQLAASRGDCLIQVTAEAGSTVFQFPKLHR